MLPDPPREKIALPAVPVAAARAGFPLVATLAPVAVSLVLWAVTRSPFGLVFALLGPIVAVGGLVDGRVSRRRARRRDEARFGAAVEEALVAVEAAHERARMRAEGSAVPTGAARWGQDASGPLPVLIGRGTVVSALEVVGSGEGSADAGGGYAAALDGVREAASHVDDAPLLVDARDGIGLIGPRALTQAIARCIGLQLAGRLSPANWQLEAGAGEGWPQALPHVVCDAPEEQQRWSTTGASEIVIAQGAGAADLPLGCGVVLDVSAGSSADASLRGLAEASRVHPAAISRAEALAAARGLAERASELGLRPPGAGLPQRVDLAELLDAAGDAPGSGLAAPIGRDSAGVVRVDLVADGPHAVVAGTTGSGKSELLVSWVLGMAAERAPGDVTFLLVDFKGGAAFAPLEALPHVLATLSDLDPRTTRRAVESLRAELRHRERVLAAARAPSIEQLPPRTLPRLVVVVDEFAALVDASPDLHGVFVDLAGRGRSLGLHLVLCTQRPAGVIRDAVLANVGLRICLRVADRADSIALLGHDAAAGLPPLPRGRGMLARDGGIATLQLAIAASADAVRIAARSAEPGDAVRRPWTDPLPRRIALDELPPGAGGGIVFGRADIPEEQLQPAAAHDPARHGHLLVLGTTGSGTTTALDTIAAGAAAQGRAVLRVPREPADAWTVLATAREHPVAGRVLLVDDLDALLARFDEDYRPAAVDLVASLLRTGASESDALVVGARRLSGALAGLAGSFGSRLLLRQGSREDHLLAGGDPARFDPDAPPGLGTWRGVEVQVAISAVHARPAAEPLPLAVVRPADHPVLAVVAGRPAALAARLREAGCRVVDLARGDAPAPDELLVARAPVPTVLLGDPDAWQAEWALLTAARRHWPIALTGCTPADHRVLLRDRGLPPPLGNRPGECWLADGGATARAVLDASATRESEEKRPPNR